MRAEDKLWRYFLLRSTLKNHVDDQVHNYYGAYFSNVKQEKYQLVSLRGRNAVLEKRHTEQHAYTKKINLPLNDIEKMSVEIIYWGRQDLLRFSLIFLFAINYSTHIAYVKNALTRAENNPFHPLASSKALSGFDRIVLLQILVSEYAHQSPEKTHTGVTCGGVIDLLYGTLWYKHIKNEDFRKKVFLLLQSLVITGGVRLSDRRYYIQGKIISTIVPWESEDKREKQQIRIQKNIGRLMFVTTTSMLMITLAILTQVGLINLHNFWVYLAQLKLIRVLFKLT